MKQYNVVVRFPTKTNVLVVKRLAIPEDLADNGAMLTDMSNPPIRPKIHNCMDLMKATALKAGLLKILDTDNITIEELSDRDYRDLETFKLARATNKFNTIINSYAFTPVKATFN